MSDIQLYQKEKPEFPFDFDAPINLPIAFLLPNNTTLCSILQPCGSLPTKVQVEQLISAETLGDVFNADTFQSIGTIACIFCRTTPLVLQIANLPHSDLLPDLLSRPLPWDKIIENVFNGRESAIYFQNDGCFDILYNRARPEFEDLVRYHHHIEPSAFFLTLEESFLPIWKFETWLRDFVRVYIYDYEGEVAVNNPFKPDPDAYWNDDVLKAKAERLGEYFRINSHMAHAIYSTAFSASPYRPKNTVGFIINIHLSASVIDIYQLGSYSEAYGGVNAQLHELYDTLCETEYTTQNP